MLAGFFGMTKATKIDIRFYGSGSLKTVARN
jgi:hypothetical protein